MSSQPSQNQKESLSLLLLQYNTHLMFRASAKYFFFIYLEEMQEILNNNSPNIKNKQNTLPQHRKNKIIYFTYKQSKKKNWLLLLFFLFIFMLFDEFCK